MAETKSNGTHKRIALTYKALGFTQTQVGRLSVAQREPLDTSATLQSFDTIPSSSARLRRPALCLIIGLRV